MIIKPQFGKELNKGQILKFFLDEIKFTVSRPGNKSISDSTVIENFLIFESFILRKKPQQLKLKYF